jgi:hypothetical protein
LRWSLTAIATLLGRCLRSASRRAGKTAGSKRDLRADDHPDIVPMIVIPLLFLDAHTWACRPSSSPVVFNLAFVCLVVRAG